ncbi:hypothetical protein HMPREF0880_03934 [Yokenella regensburgei ATCC 43003]|nr:hypothetical protein HMPREF0880_03934 [Yokenella regensburgei ATCC 43003]
MIFSENYNRALLFLRKSAHAVRSVATASVSGFCVVYFMSP